MAGDFDALVRNLKNRDSEIRLDAVISLAELGDTRAVVPLIAALRDDDWRVREAAATTLGELGDDRALRHLARVRMEDKDPRVRKAALVACRQLPSSTAKILYAEDVKDTRELVSFTLRVAGYDVWSARDGVEAVEIAQQILPDLVLLDVRMPRMTGYEACAVMKQREDLQDIPVVFLSAKGQEAEIQQGMAVGAVAYILKPFAPADLTLRIQEILAGERLGIYD